MSEQLAQRVTNFQRAAEPVFRWVTTSTWAKRRFEPDAADFALGNPNEMPLPAFVGALQKWAAPENKDWFAYKNNEPESQHIVAESLRNRYGIPFDPHDIFLTNGAFAAINISLGVITDPGDEVIFISPPWFFYEAMIAGWGAVPVRAKVNPDTFDLDLDAIAAAITARTRAIIINSPCNPTGVIYPEATLKGLAAILETASKRNGRIIYMLSDESYSKIVYDNHPFMTPTAYYPNSLLLYTYGKVLLSPGQRIGYIALSPNMPNRAVMRNAIFPTQFMTGYSFPNALLQHSLAELDKLSIDIPHLQHKRDRLVKELRAIGYQVHVPQGTFYLLPRAPISDDWAFLDLLAEYKIYCLPGTVVEMPGMFRISLTANDEMIERALPGFAAAFERASEKVAK